MTDLSAYVLARLREGEFTLYRGRADGLASILLVAPAGEYPSLGSLQHLEHEYALRADLDANWAARPAGLIRREARLMLVLDDPGGEPLERLLGGPLEVGPFLRIAVALAAALGQMHARGLIHKDLKPANILVDTASGGVWLTGFGIASRLPRERQAPAPPEVIAGTLAYMAPEQTGRLNRSIDSRSDLYALGITFYEMLTGVLPFTASDPMEWIHCHIARQPVSPSERVSAVPAQLAAIVMKLLAKTAEERYQTAAGVEADLRRCLAKWESHGRIDSFLLGGHDASDRLLIPEKLYGRKRESDSLLAAFNRVVAEGTPELVLVSGYSGVGKSSVVNELHKVLVPLRGLFAAGKFDQYKRDIPYATLAQAFQTLVRQILVKSEAEVDRWRCALMEAVEPNGQLIVSLVPELEFIIGKQPPVPDLPPRDAQNRFQLVFRRFLGAFAKPEHPLALFLDDMQWLDAATLDLLEHLLTHSEVRHLLLVGAYRDNEVGPSHPLPRTLEAIRKTGARVQEIVMAPLGLDHIGQLVADAMHCEPERVRPLAQLVHEKTGGNPFFAIQFFTALSEEELLAFDPITRAWQWDMNRIHAKSYTDNVVDLVSGKLRRLSPPTQEALKHLACLGNVAEVATLALVHGETEETMHAALWGAVRAGLVSPLDGAYRTLHDRVQEAAYALIPEGQRAAVHLRIGRMLLSHTPSSELEEKIFEIVNQLNRGAALIALQREKIKLAELNMIAGRKAKASTAYKSALNYFSAGIELLGDGLWENRHDLAYQLGFERAEAEYLSRNFDEALRQFDALLAHARTTVEKADIHRVVIDLHTTTVALDEAIARGQEALRLFGIDIPSHPSHEKVAAEYEAIWQGLGHRPIEELIDLPLMTDPETKAAMSILAVLFAPSIATDRNLLLLCGCHMVNMSIRHGNCDASVMAYGYLGMNLGPFFGDYRRGFQFGRLGYDLKEKRGLVAYKAKIEHIIGTFISFWLQPLNRGIEHLGSALKAATDAGDLNVASYCCDSLVSHKLVAGEPLDKLYLDSERLLAFTRETKYDPASQIIIRIQRFIQAMRGLTVNLSSFSDSQFDEEEYERFMERYRWMSVVCGYYIIKLQARVMSGDYQAAIAAAAKAEPLLWSIVGMIHEAEYHFYGALACAAHYDDASVDDRLRLLTKLDAHHKQLEIWAATCPENFQNRHALVSAETARIENRILDAERLYEDAIRLAREHGFIQNEGLANELAARFYAARGFEKIAHVYLRDARYCYLLWGAEGKVRQLEQSHPLLREEAAPVRLTTTMEAPQEQLDLATVVKIYQAVSGEIVIEKLIETLMVIAVEHAGAERGLLVLPQGDVQQIEAEATTGRDKVIVRLLGTPATPSDLPASVLQYVIRTEESVILDDASAQNPFLADEYIRRKRARSVLCLPLVKQGSLIGLLYLENNLASHVFTPARISVLKLLSSQAAISLENARLYAKLSDENRDRRKAEDDLRRSEAALTEAQRISHTGSWRWKVGTGEVSWSAEHFRIFAFDPATTQPSYATFMQRIHAEDRPSLEQSIQRALRERSGFQHEYRIVLPDGSVKHLQSLGQPDVTQSSDLEFVGTVMDVTERRYAEEALRSTQAELARVARLTTMGELAASLSHEINQPLGAIVTLGEAGLRWLNRKEPDLDETRDALSGMVRNAERAGSVIRGLRALARKSGPQVAKLDINDAIQEVLTLTRSEVQRHGVVLRTEPSADDRPVFGDRVQLQQVLLNLIMNAVESMGTVTDRPKTLTITSEPVEPDGLLVAVEDTGTGLDPAIADRIFDSFVTTKPEGMGMGLSICRSIIEAHGGRISASPRVPYGTVFRFTVPGIPPT